MRKFPGCCSDTKRPNTRRFAKSPAQPAAGGQGIAEQPGGAMQEAALGGASGAVVKDGWLKGVMRATVMVDMGRVSHLECLANDRPTNRGGDALLWEVWWCELPTAIFLSQPVVLLNPLSPWCQIRRTTCHGLVDVAWFSSTQALSPTGPSKPRDLRPRRTVRLRIIDSLSYISERFYLIDLIS